MGKRRAKPDSPAKRPVGRPPKKPKTTSAASQTPKLTVTIPPAMPKMRQSGSDSASAAASMSASMSPLTSDSETSSNVVVEIASSSEMLDDDLEAEDIDAATVAILGRGDSDYLDAKDDKDNEEQDSVIRAHVLGNVQNAQNSGVSCFRTVLEASNLWDIPELEWLHGGVSGTHSVIKKGGPFHLLFVYPCRNGTLINVAALYKDAGVSVRTTTHEELLAEFRDFDAKYLRLFDLPVHSTVQKWKLHVVPLLPTWILGRAALLGDAAHATLPLLGQGTAMAIEEAGALDIPARLQAYQGLQKQRGEFVRTSVTQMSGFTFARSEELQSYLFEYEAIKAADEIYQTRFGGESPVDKCLPGREAARQPLVSIAEMAGRSLKASDMQF
ncbi:hypothetical protein DFH07DRAFT_772727 [Mycena maculata]|uniref:FAD-binding domain-containing protein n=1 Tax=Mycena maculata TaxID=230809 RepID=A0AAD7J5R0_9AGAR|nr:hypothetical protein DFH07DRAFT_772727 [Mycena maculata]